MGKKYILKIAGLKRDLPLVKIDNNLTIASFVMLGDTELNYSCAREMIKKFPKESNFDFLIVPEVKSIPLAQSICEHYSEGKFKNYIVLRKGIKSYMENPLVEEVKSITTGGKQILVMSSEDVAKIKNKNVYLIDDVISTGSSYNAMIDLVKRSKANIKFAGAVLREGNFDLIGIEKKLGFSINFLGKIPLF